MSVLLSPRSLALLVLLVGCGRPASDDADSAADSGSDSGSDNGADSGADSGGDSGSDSGADSGSDSGSDSGATELPEEAGESAGSLGDLTSARLAFDAADPVEESNDNDNLYAASWERGDALDDLTGGADPSDDAPHVRYAPSSSTHVPWNSAAGRAIASSYVDSDHVSNWPFPDGRETCVTPQVAVSCCSYTLTEGEQDSGTTQKYWSPQDYFYDEANAWLFLRDVYAQIPLFLPFTDPDVKLWQGWVYSWGAAHGSIDYGKSGDAGSDTGFRVRAVASGTVVAKYWDKWHGNVVVVEHPGVAGGYDYRSFYFHVRDGQTHDVTMARTRTVAQNDPEDSRDKYLLYAAGTPDPNFWGTDAQSILVDVGDHVYAGQQIAWSGDTGPGGAGGGLDEKGVMTHPTGNNHLHFMLAVRSDDATGGDWVYVDPYGVYEQSTTGCYDLLQNTEFDRLVAPFYPYFHGVELGVYNYYLYYYGQMGRTPATLSVQRTSGGDVLAAGAMQSGLGSSFAVIDYASEATWTPIVNDLADAGYRQAERSITLDGSDDRRFNAIFRPDGGQAWTSFGGLSVDEYLDAWDTYVTDGGLDLVDFFGYSYNGEDLLAVVFADEPGAMMHQGYLSSAEFTDVANAAAEDGWLPVDVNVMEMTDGTYLSGIFRQTGDARMVHWGMSSSQYQQWMDYYLSIGWDIVQVQAYGDGTRYAAIWASQ